MEKEKKQTAVEYAEEMIEIILYHIDDEDLQRIKDAFQHAKQMDKEHKEEMYNHAMMALAGNGHGESFEEYYDKTYKK